MSTSNERSKETNKRSQVPKNVASVRFSDTTEVHKIESTHSTTSNKEQPSIRPKKRPRPERPNADEIDDVDDYTPDEDEAAGGSILDTAQTLDAKRKRRMKQFSEDENADPDRDLPTHSDRETSLASEGIPIEAFNMENEKTDGSGYFEGDTYVFRRGAGGLAPNEEADAWLDNLKEGGDEEVQLGKGHSDSITLFQRQNQQEQKKLQQQKREEKMDSLSKEELYSRLLPLIAETETVSSALIRYGQAMKQQRKHHQESNGKIDENKARQGLNDLTEIASALFMKGEVSIYQQTRQDILRALPASISTDLHSSGSGNASIAKGALWEYEGNNDRKIHGPYSTQQMMGWINLGYFVGSTAVRIRLVQEQRKEDRKISATGSDKREKGNPEAADIQKDLLSDLFDEADKDENQRSLTIGQAHLLSAQDPVDHKDENIQIRGEWMMSDKVNFQQYL